MSEVQPTTFSSERFGDLQVLHRFCPMCGHDNAGANPSPYSLDIWDIVNCSDCSFTYIDKAPIYEELKDNISWEKTFEIEVDRRTETRPISYKVSRMTRWRMNLFPRNKFPDLVDRFAPEGHILDVGCGSGEQMKDLDARFYPSGIEISAELATHAAAFFKQYGGDCVCAPALKGLQSLPENRFSGVTMRSYLEHESQPLDVLQAIHRILLDGGVAIIKVPNYGSINRLVMGKKWCGFRYPDHQNYFTPKSLRQMGRKAGFTKFKSHWSFALPTSDNMYLVMEK